MGVEGGHRQDRDRRLRTSSDTETVVIGLTKITTPGFHQTFRCHFCVRDLVKVSLPWIRHETVVRRRTGTHPTPNLSHML